MNDPPSIIPLAGQRLKPSKRQYASQSPTRYRPADDLLADLAPASAVRALRSPTGTLRTCLDGATPSEHAFAMRTAMASQSILDWLDELSDWSWPAGGGPAGFLPPAATNGNHIQEIELAYIGSVAASEINRYERRVREITQEMDELKVEDIKAQVLYNHITPLSRPGTPMSDSARISYTRMDDLTAVITAIVVQALPNLSKLARMLNVWRVRLAVLVTVPVLLEQIEDAEVALQGGWNAVNLPPPSNIGVDGDLDGDIPVTTTLTRKDFDIMRLVLEKKVSAPGKTLDSMLDSLEGLEDTLPDEWLDRMEGVEKGYSDWYVAAETKIREAEWALAARARRAAEREAGGVRPQPEKKLPSEHKPEALPLPDPLPEAEPMAASEQEPTNALQTREEDEEQLEARGFSGPKGASTIDPEPPKHLPEALPMEASAKEDEEDEVELPPLPSKRSSQSSTGSGASQSSTNLSFESELPRTAASPIRPRPRDIEVDDSFSLQSSPPVRKAKPRASSVTFSDSPAVAPTPSFEEEEGEEEGDTRPNTPLMDSFMDDMDDSPSILVQKSPMKRRGGSGSDDQLQQQISEILEGIPAKFTLSSEPSPINLNPPGLDLPRMKKPSKDPMRRSHSSLSSRAPTPAFMLSPAFTKNPRPRHKSTQQDIKVYHLSRSTGEAPIKLFIRCVGENGERVMVRVGGGWADLGEYLKEYATHHGRRSTGAGSDRIEIRDLPRVPTSRGTTSSPPSRPASALDYSPMTPLNVKKARKSFGAGDGAGPSASKAENPRTPANGNPANDNTPSSEASTRSRSSSRLSWGEEDSPMLGLAGPTSRPVEMSEESKAWVESVKEKVRLASGERKPSGGADSMDPNRFGDMGKVGATKRLFRKK